MKYQWKKIENGSCDRMIDVPSGAIIESIDGKDVIAVCENCGKHLTEGMNVNLDVESVELCDQCWSELITEDNK